MKKKNNNPELPKLFGCCVCGSKNIKYASFSDDEEDEDDEDSGLEKYKAGDEIGVVFGEHITGCYSWDDVVVPLECDNGHTFYCAKNND